MTEILEAAQREFGDPDHAVREWAQSLDRYNMATARERRQAWIRHHKRQVATHRLLADEHEQAVTSLLADSAAGR